MSFTLTRRSALAAGALLPVAAGLGAMPARAAAGMRGPSTPVHYRFRLGAFEVTTLLAGTALLENPQQTFGLNASAEEFAAASAAAFVPVDRSLNAYTPTLINTGEELILFDTGPSAAATLAALTAAGHTADEVDIVVITHMHGDHINGLQGDTGVTYPNARYVTGSVENNHWAATGNENYERAVRPLLGQFTFIEEGETVASGITAMAAFGHTPGHFIYHVESGGRRLALTADLANHAAWSIARPEWEVRFDMDKEAAAASRRRVLGMLAADRIPFIAYHVPFPAVGFVEEDGDGFRHVPVGYQMLLDQ